MKKTYVLNKPALLTSEESLLRFEGHDIIIPMAVLEDLQSSLSNLKSARQTIARKVLDQVDGYDFKALSSEGVKLENGTLLKVTVNYNDIEIKIEGVSSKDRRILQTCKGLQSEGLNVVLISNNPVIRMKARDLGIVAEALKDRVFPSIKDQYKGYVDVFCSSLCIDDLHNKGYLDVKNIYESDKIDWCTNLYVNMKGENSSSALGYFDGSKIVPIFANQKPYGINPKNVRQKFLIHALMDVETPLVIVKGNAGTGKTFCSLAAALQQTFEENIYEQILITKSTKKVDQEELGFLPGDISEKIDPFISGIYDNLEMLYKPASGKYDNDSGFNKKTFRNKRNIINGDLFETGVIEIQTLGHIRGRSIMNKYFIIDETQNIAPEAIKQITTRAGEGSKFVFLGDPSQIDSLELTEKYNGLVYLSEMMKGRDLCRQITLNNIGDAVRSPLAQLAVDVLL